MPKTVSKQRRGNPGSGHPTQCETKNAQCEKKTAQYEQRKAQCEPENAQCEIDKAQCEALTSQCESQKAQCESHNAQCEIDHDWSDQPRSKKFEPPALGRSLKNPNPFFQDRYHNLNRVPKHDSNFLGEHKSYFDNTAPVQWRAGLIAPSRQRHLTVRPHHTADTTRKIPPCKCRRGKRSEVSRLRRFTEFTAKRQENRKQWRHIKRNSSEALRKVIAASSLGDAIQEANWLNAKLNSKSRVKKANPLGHPYTDKFLFRFCKKKHSQIIQLWKERRKILERRKIERKTRKVMLKRNRNKFDNNPSAVVKKKRTPNDPNPSVAHQSFRYRQTIGIATLNCRGLAEAGKRDQIIKIMKTHQIDLLALQETKVNYSSEEIKQLPGCTDKFLFRFSSNSHATNRAVEHHGVGFVIGPKILNSVKDCIPHSSRFIEIIFQNHGPDIRFINHYAPHSGRPHEEKTHHWETLQNILDRQSRNIPTYILGDTNARLHGRISEVENECVGRHVFGFGAQHVHNLAEEQRENRQLLIDFCVFNDFTVMNTLFLKPDKFKCTFKETTTDGFSSPWSPDRFAQIDLILAPRSFKNSILDVSSRTDIAFNSDHSVVTAKFRLSLKQRPKIPSSSVTRYHFPSDAQKLNFNQWIRSHLPVAEGSSVAALKLSDFVSLFKHAAEATLTKQDRSQNHGYLSEHTWQLIQERQISREQNQVMEEKRLNREISRSAKNDRQTWKTQRLGDLTNPRECWKAIKFEKSNFMPNFYNLKDIRGNRVPNSEKANAIAEYLHEVHWKPNDLPIPVDPRKVKIIHQDMNFNVGQLTHGEIESSIRNLKPHKAPGPDEIIAELFKFLDQENIGILTDCLNKLWNTKSVPATFASAQIATLYKKGNHEDPENYRPISLLNVSYKIYAYTIKNRLAQVLEDYINPTQFGFRKGRSTVDPLFCVRRISDVAEQGHESLVLVFLDWEKAFDKLSHQKMFCSLQRLNIPEPLIQAIKSLYSNPMFQVISKENISPWLQQRTGIRQGCPLSPFLFILTMHCMFHDIASRFHDPRHIKSFQGINFKELLFADDTLIVAKSAAIAKSYLHLIEEESDYLDLKLNRQKCCYIAYNCQGAVTFKNGEHMRHTTEAVYLGASISNNHDPKHEIRRRISSTMPVLKKLDIFWLKTDCSKKWKLLVFNAVICSKLLYGLETLEPTETAGRLLDTFQLKGLRKILKLNTTFIQRRNSNEYVFRRANEVLGGPAEGRMRKIRPLTEILQERKLKLLGHILRRERQHPLHQSTFATRSALPRETDHRRVGRPRQFWTVKTMERAWDIIRSHDQSQPQIPFDKHDRRMRERIISQAQNYDVPFQRG